MIIFDNRYDIRQPGHLVERHYEFSDRLKLQHFIFLCVVLYSLSLYTKASRVYKGSIGQMQVSIFNSVPQDVVIARAQMLFFVLTPCLNRPVYQIVGDEFLNHRCLRIIRCQSNVIVVSFATRREHVLGSTQIFQPSETLDQPISLGYPQANSLMRSATIIQDIPAVVAKYVELGIDPKTAIRSSYITIIPFSFFTVVDQFVAQIEPIKQDIDLEMVCQDRLKDALAEEYHNCCQIQS